MSIHKQAQGKKVLFIGHDAGAHGAQILLLNLLKWFKRESSFSFSILLRNGGPLETEFFDLAPCSVWSKTATVPKFPFLCKRDTLAQYKDIDLIYSNTITNGDLLEELASLNVPVITHIHELENYIKEIGPDGFSKVKRYSNLFIAASNAVKENLVINHGIPDNKVHIVYSFIPTDSFCGSAVARPKDVVLKELCIPSDGFIVGASGTIDWRKNTDSFVQLASYFANHLPDEKFYFLWIGGSKTWEIEYDLKMAGLKNIFFVPHVQNTIDYFNCIDAFALVSRIDPYPLVCLEAASLGKPLICFNKSGGMPEFIENDAGFVVPYLDIRSMADAVLAIARDPMLANRLGTTGERKVRERHDIERAGREISAIIARIAFSGHQCTP